MPGSRGLYPASMESECYGPDIVEKHDSLTYDFSDLAHEPGKHQAIFTPKHKVNEYLAEKASEGKIEYTVVSNGPFFDWGMYYLIIKLSVQN